MKKIIILINLTMIFSLVYSQEFPSPENFEIEVCYNNPYGTCGFEYPEYSYVYTYQFNTPDTAGIEADLIEYNIYFDNYSDTSLIHTILDTIYTVSNFGIGQYYVTAVYSDPDGESSPSNIVELTDDDFPLFIENSDLQKEILIYPNPTNGKINILISEQIEKITICDISGKVILKTTRKEINLSEQKTGTYFLKIETATSILTEKIIIK
ncbi:MAG: T9SS type A sorting domain-containing protein [Bacteroidales bacterium]|nr:T9SS type A sorting domain-containing protein [Bacteroidales bacterium]